MGPHELHGSECFELESEQLSQIGQPSRRCVKTDAEQPHNLDWRIRWVPHDVGAIPCSTWSLSVGGGLCEEGRCDVVEFWLSGCCIYYRCPG